MASADNLKKEGKLSYGYLREIIAAAEHGLAPYTAGDGGQMFISWRKRKEEIDADVRTMLAAAAGRDEKAERREADLLGKIKIIAGNVKKRKISGAGKVVEIVAAKFHNVPKGRAILVQDGSFISKGEEIVDGDSNPHEILAMRGVEALVEHIVNEVQDVYRLQGVNINDKHIEVIIHQMMRCACVTDPGDSHLIPGDNVMRTELLKTNTALEKAGDRPAKARVILMGITKASLATDSFYFGGVVSRNFAGADRSGGRRAARFFARTQRKRYCRAFWCRPAPVLSITKKPKSATPKWKRSSCCATNWKRPAKKKKSSPRRRTANFSPRRRPL